MTEALSLDGVTVRRGTKTLLDSIDFSASDADRWAVLGPNGAGKTTLLQVAAGRMHPTSGTATILGEQLGKVDVFELRPRIGLASANLAARIPASETALDAVVTASYAVTGRWRESYDTLDHGRATDLLYAFGVEHLAERTFGTLSDGERKRVQIARALMTDPELLLLDEPAAGLDLGGREELIGALTEIMHDRHSPVVVMVTHHVEEIPPGITHVLLLADGGVVAAGPIGETLTAENLSATFGVRLSLAYDDGRYAARAQR
ncbi:ABC transporter ATP-binding protein [Spelaeicoccus albus]|uniref:Iron complex transport system ATP-binding protein n=1 Tax=Spelaeicoccus albus TaxID=1280376 RepID=A0A7Z0D438_9MICO|nr:ABC transporter ATP-binding protein [Spelaeicoccus albus]NYI68501.1 iron complex transport system ATP-binding protein [Spelaeicoccus albus]